LGEAAASYVERILKSGSHVAVDHGRSVFYTVKALNEGRKYVVVAPLMPFRGLGVEEGKIPSWVNAVHLAAKFWMDQPWNQVIPQYLEPLEGKDLFDVTKQMRSSRAVEEALAKINLSNVVLLSVGVKRPHATVAKLAERAGIPYAQLLEKGFAGTICHTPVDDTGRPIGGLGLDKLAISIDLKQLRKLASDTNRDIILIAGGEKKLDMIKAAITQRYANVLVTDEIVAERLLSQD
jgi:deoxyribonucleoside regulator